MDPLQQGNWLQRPQAQSFYVSRAVMFETLGYDPQFMRPFQTQYDYQIHNALVEQTEGGQNTTQQALTGVANQFLQPKSSVDRNSQALIDNGFPEPRFSFFIEVTMPEPGMNAQRRYIITGYTDRADYSYSGELPPDLTFYFNNMITIRDVQQNTPQGPQTRSTIIENHHIVGNLDPNQAYLAGNMSRHTLDPHSVLKELYMQSESLLQEVRSDLGNAPNVNVVTQGATRTSPSLVPRRHESRPSYMADTISNYQSAMTQGMTDESLYMDNFQTAQEDASWDPGEAAFSKASSSLRTPSPSQHVLLKQFMQGTHTFLQSGAITFQELCGLLPGMSENLHIIYLSQPQRQSAYQPGMGEHWTGSGHEHMAATVIVQNLPPILSDCLTRKMAFWATNDVPGTQDTIQYVEPPEGFVEGLDFRPFKDFFEQRLRAEILSDISKWGNLVYHVYVEINMVQEARIWVSIDHQEQILFVCPMFCDSTFAPILTADVNDVHKVGNDMRNMLYDISGQQQPHQDTSGWTMPQAAPAGESLGGSGPINVNF